jgi:hypothetical protein
VVRPAYRDAMAETHRARVEWLLTNAAAEHASMIGQLPADLQASLPVDAQGVTRAIDHLANAAGLSVDERRALIQPHAANPAVMHARVYGGAPLTVETVIGSFVEGARVRAEALAVLADAIGGEPLGTQICVLLVASPPPLRADGADVIVAGPGRRRVSAQSPGRSTPRILPSSPATRSIRSNEIGSAYGKRTESLWVR